MTNEPVATEVWQRIAPYFTVPAEHARRAKKYPSVLRFADGREVKTPADWKRRREEIRQFWMRAMGPWPELLVKPQVRYLDREDVENFTRHHVKVEVASGRMTDAYLLAPHGKGPFPAVLNVFYGPEEGAGLVDKAGMKYDYAYQLARRGFVTLSVGGGGWTPDQDLQPLSCLAYQAANCHTILADLPQVDGDRVGVVGLSFGGKWAMFASCLYEKFACAVWSDPGIVFNEEDSNVNYYEPWYIGAEPGKTRRKGIPSRDNPRTGPYKMLYESGHDLHELHALMAPRPFLVSGGQQDPPIQWAALTRTVEVNRLLGYENRVAMTNRPTHVPEGPESMEQVILFFQYFLRFDSLGKVPRH